VRQPLSNFDLSGTQRLSPSSVGPFGLFLSMLIYFFVCAEAGKCLPRVMERKRSQNLDTSKTAKDRAPAIALQSNSFILP
jgi:hypothetical protein